MGKYPFIQIKNWTMDEIKRFFFSSWMNPITVDLPVRVRTDSCIVLWPNPRRDSFKTSTVDTPIDNQGCFHTNTYK